MERTKLLNELVEIDALITAATSRAALAPDDIELEQIIEKIRELRKLRQEIQAKLDALNS